MNRRNFFGSLLMAGAGFMILPGRVWKAVREPVIVMPVFHQTLGLYWSGEVINRCTKVITGVITAGSQGPAS